MSKIADWEQHRDKIGPTVERSRPDFDLLVAHQVITDDAMVASITSRWDGAVAGGRVLVEVQPAMSCGTRPTTGRLSAGLMKSWTNQTPSSNRRPRMVSEWRLEVAPDSTLWCSR